MIPKILHQIWVGPHPAPRRYIDQWGQVCKQYGWEHRLWGNEQIDREVRFTRRLYDLQEAHCHKADLYRLEILYRHGGVYIDADTVPTGSDPALYLPVDRSDLIGTCEHHFPVSDFSQKMWENVHDPPPDDLCPAALVLFCGFIAAVPRHPQVLTWLKALSASWERSLSVPRDNPRPPELRMPAFSYVMSRHLFHPMTVVPFSMLTGKPDAFARWLSILPAECYPLNKWHEIKKKYPHLTESHPDETTDQ